MEPKYIIGQEVFYLTENSIQSGKVSGIQKSTFGWEYSVSEVHLNVNVAWPTITHYYHSEDHYFPSKEDLLVHLSEGMLIKN